MQLLVLIPGNLKYDLVYSSKDEGITSGDVVLVPLRKRNFVGVVWNTIEGQNYEYEVKDIIEKLPGIHFDKNIRDFIDLVARYNLIKRGLVLKMFLGPLVRRHKTLMKKFTKADPRVIKIPTTQKNHLSNDQQLVFDEIVLNKGDQVSVLDGVTNSGKTELYLQLARQVVSEGGQVLILLPEILLTTQVIERAKQIIGEEIYPWHSGVKQKDKDQVWIGVQSNHLKVVIGTRSSLFLPFSNLQVIIVDEEHDISFKQENPPIYNAVTMAILRAKMLSIRIVLTSATPSVETMYHVKQGDYKYFHLNSKNFKKSSLAVEVVNLWEVSNKNEKIFPLLHPRSLDEIAKTLASGQQSLIFLNRKGYAATTLCSNCMTVLRCKNCDIKLTYYKDKKRMKCRHCGYVIGEQKTCSTCGQESLFTYHPGIEKLNEELIKNFPKARIMTVTRDSLEDERADSIIKRIMENEVDIVIGTQILAKGLHFPRMRLCVIVDANNTKFGGDIRSLERTYQVLQQVIGRVGRETPGLAIIQTFNKKSSVINSITSGNKQDFISLELQNREAAKVHPYGSFILINIGSLDEKKLQQWLSSIEIPESSPQIKVFGPIPAAIHRIHRKYRYQILFKGGLQDDLTRVVSEWLETITIPHYISLTADVEPQSFY